jgi:hypothetical protein
MPPRPHVIVGTPCYGGLVTHVYVHSLLKLMAYATARGGLEIGLYTAAHDSLVTRSRNSIVAGFLDQAAATHLMFVDADTGFEPEDFARLLAFDEDVVAGMYPVKNVDWAQTARRAAAGGATLEELREAGLHFVGVPCAAGGREERDGFVTADYAGAGFMLIRRAAIERLVRAHPELKYEVAQTYPAPARRSDHLYALFDCTIDPETRTYLSEDFAFCARHRRLGGKVWLDTQSRLKHVGAYEFQGRFARSGG